MIFASFAGYGFNDFFVYQGKLSIFFVVQAGMLAGAIYFYAFFSKANTLKISIERQSIVSLVPSILLILMILGLAIVSFFYAGISTASGLLVVSLGIAGLIWYAFIQREGLPSAFKIVKGLDWETILFLIGIFIVIGAVAETGLLEDLANMLSALIGGNVLLGFIVIILVSVLISGFVDNVPYIIAMLPVTAAISDTLKLKPELYMFALLVGSCLGGNLTPFGASANVVTVGILKKEGVILYFPDWLKTGLPFTIITTLAASLLLWFVWHG
jgi:Na+/H+ antiporter NhaD/arsenite permease-like protein